LQVTGSASEKSVSPTSKGGRGTPHSSNNAKYFVTVQVDRTAAYQAGGKLRLQAAAKRLNTYRLSA